MLTNRTWLFVPAKQKFCEKIAKISADVIILDLEDALTLEQKEDGRRLAIEVIKTYGNERNIYVRINAGERMREDLAALSSYAFEGYMLPKFEDLTVLDTFEEELRGKKVIALVESVKGVMRLEEIASHPKVDILAFGGEDFCKELGYFAGEEATLYARSKVVLYAAYYQKCSLDTICLETADMDRFREAYSRTKRLGFDGKLLIHPKQVDAVKELQEGYSKEKMERILQIYQNSEEGIVQIDGRWYEKPHIDKIKSYLERIGE